MDDNEIKETLKTITANIRKAREIRHSTQRKVAEYSGLSLNTILKIEHNKNKDISITTLIKIANSLNCNLDDLLPQPNNFINNTLEGKVYLQIQKELKEMPLHFLRYIRMVIRQTKNLEAETERQRNLGQKK